MKKHLVTAGIIVRIAVPALAEDLVTVKTGAIHGSGGDMYDYQAIAVTNHSDKLLSYVEIERGFFRGDQLIGAGKALVENLKPSQTAYAEALHYNHERKVRPDHGECRVVKVKDSDS
jgi:hypothetical protein